MTDLTGVFEITTIYCMNHAEPLPMSIIQNAETMKSPFFVCPKNGECPNRLNIDDYEGIVNKLMAKMAEGMMLDDLTGWQFSYRGPRHKIDCKVLLYSDKEIRIGIRNRTVMG